MKTRRLISLTTFIAFIFLAFSGIMLFFSPQGRVAYWAGWEMLGLSKDQYTAVHTTFMILFLTVGIWHIVLNWKPIVGYLKDRSKKVRVTRPEFLTSLGICLLFFIGPLTRIPPFAQLLDAGEGIKAYWERTHGSPPWGHAEESPLDRFCSRIGGFQRSAAGEPLAVDCQEAVVALESAGIAVEGLSQRLIDIANANDITPQAVADIVLSVAQPPTPGVSRMGAGEGGSAGLEGGRFPHPGSGMGRITLREYSVRFDLDLDEILALLKEKGMEIDPDERFREAATRLGTDPVGILEALNEG
ncbi:DUF4405 domain-containing protein [Gemmatimonadota bacterium]